MNRGHILWRKIDKHYLVKKTNKLRSWERLQFNFKLCKMSHNQKYRDIHSPLCYCVYIFDRVSSSCMDDERQPIFRRKNLDMQEEVEVKKKNHPRFVALSLPSSFPRGFPPHLFFFFFSCSHPPLPFIGQEITFSPAVDLQPWKLLAEGTAN